jgi:hypothetical protein
MKYCLLILLVSQYQCQLEPSRIQIFLIVSRYKPLGHRQINNVKGKEIADYVILSSYVCFSSMDIMKAGLVTEI